jgi:hypothetical protein
VNVYLKWVLLFPASIIMTAAGYVLAPILPAFASEDGWLPDYLDWFQTYDNPLDGDYGFKTIHAPFKGDNLSYWQKYINRVFWLWRNPVYGFDKDVIGVTIPDSFHWTRTRLYGEKDITGDLSPSGWYFAVLRDESGEGKSETIAWQLYIVHHWNDSHTTKINLGWKVWSAPDSCSYASTFNIWKSLK